MVRGRLILAGKDSGVPVVVIAHDSRRVRRRLDKGDSDSRKVVGTADAVFFPSAHEAALCNECGGGGNLKVLEWTDGDRPCLGAFKSHSVTGFADSLGAAIGRRLPIDLCRDIRK